MPQNTHICIVAGDAVIEPLNPTESWHRSGNYVLETQENLDNGNPRHNGHLCT